MLEGVEGVVGDAGLDGEEWVFCFFLWVSVGVYV